MVRKKIIQKYKELYEEGKDRENSLGQYSDFFSNFFENISLRELIGWMVKEKSKIKVLDVGCGDAGFLNDLKKQFGEKVFTSGIDLIDFTGTDEKIIGDALNAEWPKEFDLIVSFRTLHEIGNSEKILTKALDSLKKNGMAVLSFRMQEFVNGQLDFLGEMKQGDARFLQQIGERAYFKKAQIESVESFKKEKGIKFLNGVTLIMEKTG